MAFNWFRFRVQSKSSSAPTINETCISLDLFVSNFPQPQIPACLSSKKRKNHVQRDWMLCAAGMRLSSCDTNRRSLFHDYQLHAKITEYWKRTNFFPDNKNENRKFSIEINFNLSRLMLALCIEQHSVCGGKFIAEIVESKSLQIESFNDSAC